MENEKSIDVLNTLITINNDRIEGYETANDETEESELHGLFNRFISTSKKCKNDLVQSVIKLGGEESQGTKNSGKFFRVWMDVKAALTGKDRKAILESCAFGEEKADETYKDVVENDFDQLSVQDQTMVKEQRTALQSDFEHVKMLRDALVKA